MDFGLSDEQRMLKEVAQAFVAEVCPPERAKEWDEAETVPEELFKGLADMGWLALPFPAEDGGGDGGAIELAVLAEEPRAAPAWTSPCATSAAWSSA